MAVYEPDNAILSEYAYVRVLLTDLETSPLVHGENWHWKTELPRIEGRSYPLEFSEQSFLHHTPTEFVRTAEIPHGHHVQNGPDVYHPHRVLRVPLTLLQKDPASLRAAYNAQSDTLLSRVQQPLNVQLAALLDRKNAIPLTVGEYIDLGRLRISDRVDVKLEEADRTGRLDFTVQTYEQAGWSCGSEETTFTVKKDDPVIAFTHRSYSWSCKHSGKDPSRPNRKTSGVLDGNIFTVEDAPVSAAPAPALAPV